MFIKKMPLFDKLFLKLWGSSLPRKHEGARKLEKKISRKDFVSSCFRGCLFLFSVRTSGCSAIEKMSLYYIYIKWKSIAWTWQSISIDYSRCYSDLLYISRHFVPLANVYNFNMLCHVDAASVACLL
jgi:hypothetical protein